MPKDLLHSDETLHRHIHSVYGSHYKHATYKRMRKGHCRNICPSVLSRNVSAGSQCFRAIWTVDDTVSWEKFCSSVRMPLRVQILSMFISRARVGCWCNLWKSYFWTSSQMIYNWVLLAVLEPMHILVQIGQNRSYLASPTLKRMNRPFEGAMNDFSTSRCYLQELSKY